MDKKGCQIIHCTVESCEHHEKNDTCMLHSIQVSPLTSVADSPEESMCESFERKDD